MTLSVPESVISIYIEKRRQLHNEVSPFSVSFVFAEGEIWSPTTDVL